MLFQGSANSNVTLSATSVNVLPARTGDLQRTQLIITNTSASTSITLTKGDNAAVSTQGIVLQPNQTFIEATDGGYYCWQGAIQGVTASGAGSCAVNEAFIQPD